LTRTEERGYLIAYETVYVPDATTINLCLSVFPWAPFRSTAVKTQMWIAISVYVLVAIVKKRRNLPRSLYENLQILSFTLCE